MLGISCRPMNRSDVHTSPASTSFLPAFQSAPQIVPLRLCSWSQGSVLAGGRSPSFLHSCVWCSSRTAILCGHGAFNTSPESRVADISACFFHTAPIFSTLYHNGLVDICHRYQIVRRILFGQFSRRSLQSNLPASSKIATSHGLSSTMVFGY